MTQYYGFDFETHLITDHCITPVPVCVSWSNGAGDDGVASYRSGDAIRTIQDLFYDPDVVLIAHNLPYDAELLARYCTIPPYLIRAAIDVGKLRDTRVREQLIQIALGGMTTKRDPRTGYPMTSFSLAALAKTYLKLDLSAEKTAPDAWRLRYSELDAVPVADWPDAAYDYALLDSEYALRVFAHQSADDNRTSFGRLQDPDDRMLIRDEIPQTRAAFDLHCMACNGPLLDQAELDRFVKYHESEVRRGYDAAQADGLVKWNKNKYPKLGPPKSIERGGWSEDQKYLRECVAADLTAQGIDVPKTASGQISIAEDVLAQCSRRDIRTYASTKGSQKMLSTYAGPALRAKDQRLVSYPNVLLNTGRCVKFDTAILTEFGRLPIYMVEVGDRVVTHKNRLRRVIDTCVKPAELMYKLIMSDGSELTCTSGHMMYTTQFKWVPLSEILDECRQEMGRRPKEYQSSGETIQTAGAVAYSGAGSRAAGYDRAQCIAHSEATIHPTRTHDAQISTHSGKEIRGRQSHVRQVCRAASQLYRRLCGWLRVPDASSGREEVLCPSGYHGGIAGDARQRITGGTTSTPHRLESPKQRSGQLGTLHLRRTQKNSFFTGEGFEGNFIKKADISGVHTVYDITVDEDESYFAAGVFHHNSSWRAPNLQNPPKKPGYRECFVPAPGNVYVSIDYDGIEMAALAQVFSERHQRHKLREAINNGYDVHAVFGAEIIGRSYDEFVAIRKDVTHEDNSLVATARQAAKPFNFGRAGGMGAETFLSTLDDDVKAALQALEPDNDLVAITTRLLRLWDETWEARPFFQAVSKSTKAYPSGRFTYRHPLSGRVRGNVGYCDGCNLQFQGRVADGAKAALKLLSDWMYSSKKSCKVRSWAFIHDEFLFEGPAESVTEWAQHATDLMVEGMQPFMKDVQVTASPAAMNRWMKDADTYYDDAVLIPWDRYLLWSDDHITAPSEEYVKSLGLREGLYYADDSVIEYRGPATQLEKLHDQEH